MRWGDYVSLLDPTWPWRGFHARAQESRQSDPSLCRRVAPLPPIPACRAWLRVTQTRYCLGRGAACSARGSSRAAPTPLVKNVTAPAGLSRNRPPGGSSGGSVPRSGLQRERVGASPTPCAVWQEGEPGKGSLPGPFHPPPSLGTGCSSPRPLPLASGCRRVSFPVPQSPRRGSLPRH